MARRSRPRVGFPGGFRKPCRCLAGKGRFSLSLGQATIMFVPLDLAPRRASGNERLRMRFCRIPAPCFTPIGFGSIPTVWSKSLMTIHRRHLSGDNRRKRWSLAIGPALTIFFLCCTAGHVGILCAEDSSPPKIYSQPLESSRTPRLRSPRGPAARLGDVPQPHPVDQSAEFSDPRRSPRQLCRRA